MHIIIVFSFIIFVKPYYNKSIFVFITGIFTFLSSPSEIIFITNINYNYLI